jgi:hypothetical protein
MAAMLDTNAANVMVRLILAWITPLFNRIVSQLLRPAAPTTLIGAFTELTRSKADLIAENALLRHQLALLKRQSKRSRLKATDRLSLLLLAKETRSWRQALLIVQPATLLRWHRQGFRLLMRFKQHQPKCQTRFSIEIIALIRQMARDNPLWGAERIRGELLKPPTSRGQARDHGRQANGAALHGADTDLAYDGTGLGKLPQDPYPRHMGMRFRASHRPVLSTTLCLLHH